MRTKRQEELLEGFFSLLGEESRSMYEELTACLEELGYHPGKERSNLSFKHDLHNKQIVKMGMKKGKEPAPFFSLRFSGCEGYSQRFRDIVRGYAAKNPARTARCPQGECGYCQGAADTHVYLWTSPDGEQKSYCGAYAIDIPDMTPKDMEEIKRLILEEHTYLLEHEAGITEE